MFQIAYQHNQTWPDDGPIHIQTPALEGDIHVSPDSARRRANGYLARYVAMAAEAGSPSLLWGRSPHWQMPIYLSLRGLGQVAILGTIEVDARTRDVVPLSAEQITDMQNRADAIAQRLT